MSPIMGDRRMQGGVLLGKSRLTRDYAENERDRDRNP